MLLTPDRPGSGTGGHQTLGGAGAAGGSNRFDVALMWMEIVLARQRAIPYRRLPAFPGRLAFQIVTNMRAIDNFDPKTGPTNRKQVAICQFKAGGFRRGRNRLPLWLRFNLFAVNVCPVATPQILDLNHRRMNVQLAMVSGNELIPFRTS